MFQLQTAVKRMKQLLKKHLPQPVINTVRYAKEWTYLKSLPPLTFDPATLAAEQSFSPAQAFNDEAIAADWEQELKALSDVLGSQHYFGGINPGDRRALYSILRALKPQNVLEIGTHIGASTIFIARALKSNNNKASVTTVDILDVNNPEQGAWKKLGLPYAPKDLAAKLDCSAMIKFQTASAVSFFKSTGQCFDFIFLDGNHGPQAVYQEIAGALQVLKPGGMILLHDYYPDGKTLFPDGNVIAGPYMAMARIQKENSAIKVLPLGNLPWETKQGSHATSLALVLKKSGK